MATASSEVAVGAAPLSNDAPVVEAQQQVDSPHAEPQVRAAAVEDNEQLTAAVSSLEIAEEKGQPEPDILPAHRSHDPQFNQKRTDPFQFGSRFLEDGDDPFEYNAWDHVETDDAYKEYAEQQYEMQRQSPVSDFDKCKFAIPYFFFFNLHKYFQRHYFMMIYITA